MKTKKENQLRAWPICPIARRFMRKLLTITFTILGCLAFCPRPALALVFSAPSPKSVYTDTSGKKQSAQVVDKYYPKKIVQPFAKSDTNIDPKLRRAATIAEERAHAHSLSKCWHFVKEALVAAGVVKSRPQTTLAKQAGQELVNNYGFKKLPVSNPYEAPVGSVLVYGAKSAAGHVEIRTENGFASDFRSKIPSRRPLLGVFAKS
jgi:hypothetical protein